METSNEKVRKNTRNRKRPIPAEMENTFLSELEPAIFLKGEKPLERCPRELPLLVVKCGRRILPKPNGIVSRFETKFRMNSKWEKPRKSESARLRSPAPRATGHVNFVSNHLCEEDPHPPHVLSCSVSGSDVDEKKTGTTNRTPSLRGPRAPDLNKPTLQ